MAQHPELEVVFGLPERTIPLAKPDVLIGSRESADVWLAHSSVAPDHCRIFTQGGSWWVEDLGSVNGTFVRGVPVRGRLPLAEGTVVHAGSVGLRLVGITEDGDRRAPGMRSMLVANKPSTRIPLGRHAVLLGSDPACDAILDGAGISPRHARVERAGSGYRAVALHDRGECRINGLHFAEHVLIYGDALEIGPFTLRFDGRSLRLVERADGARLVADELTLTLGDRRILDRVSLVAEPNQFVGIVGPSGAGKSSMLRALIGLRPADSGQVWLDGVDVAQNFGRLSREFGWVPQENTVHRELTVAQALAFAAKLRLPSGTPRAELARLVAHTAERMGLQEHLGSVVGTLSGGELKKVSVGVELLCRPQILFLDEPTSGLDPGAEARLMELLRRLADEGCTVICTTHVMQNAYLLDQVAVLSDGALCFSGKADEVRRFFTVREVTSVFGRLAERPADEWRETYERAREGEPKPQIDPPRDAEVPAPRTPQLPLVVARQFAILASDWRNFLILFGQPALIGGLVAWAVNGTVDDAGLKLFFAAIATLWFGCSNGAQEIIGEVPIFRRERLAGLQKLPYLLGKWFSIGLVTLAQSAVLFAIIQWVGEGVGGSVLWQAGGLAVMALLSAGFGLAISAVARTPMQAVLLVPLFIIPQIILSGYTVPTSEMRPSVRWVSNAIPTFQLQNIMDTSLLWQREINAGLIETRLQAFRNMNPDRDLRMGDTFTKSEPAQVGFVILGIWFVVTLVVALLALSRKERDV